MPSDELDLVLILHEQKVELIALRAELAALRPLAHIGREVLRQYDRRQGVLNGLVLDPALLAQLEAEDA